MDHILLLIFGVLLSVLGIVNITGNITTIHSYNRKKVKEEDIPKYGRVMGTGTLIIGLALIASFVLELLNSNIPTDYVITPAFVLGAFIMLYGQRKYNKGIF